MAFFLVAVGFLFCRTLVTYHGSWVSYTIFSISLHVLLYLGFRRGHFFFDTFIGVFLWLGFWLKASVRLSFLDGRYSEGIGAFDSSAASYDKLFFIVSVGVVGFICANLLRRKSLKYVETPKSSILKDFYLRKRSIILVAFFVLFSSWSFINLYFGIYQRGMIPQMSLPYGLTGVLKWLVLFGGTTFSSVILHCESKFTNSFSKRSIFLVLFESFMSCSSMLSRGMILNSSSLLWGSFQEQKRRGGTVTIKKSLFAIATFLILFLLSNFLVNGIRQSIYDGNFSNTQETSEYKSALEKYNLAKMNEGVSILFLDRWVGIEGAMAISSYDDLGYTLFKEALSEKYVKGELSFYDGKMIVSPYSIVDLNKNNFISLPGVIAFFYYPGSSLFLFFAILTLGLFGGVLEYLTFRFAGNNLILCSVIGQVIAYRYAHFGYLPKQSYLLVGSIILNIVIICLSGKVISRVLVAYSSRKKDLRDS